MQEEDQRKNRTRWSHGNECKDTGSETVFLTLELPFRATSQLSLSGKFSAMSFPSFMNIYNQSVFLRELSALLMQIYKKN